jgi:hypothetical protein
MFSYKCCLDSSGELTVRICSGSGWWGGSHYLRRINREYRRRDQRYWEHRFISHVALDIRRFSQWQFICSCDAR